MCPAIVLLSKGLIKSTRQVRDLSVDSTNKKSGIDSTRALAGASLSTVPLYYPKRLMVIICVELREKDGICFQDSGGFRQFRWTFSR